LLHLRWFLRVRNRQDWENVTTEGIDIVISLDISTSMLAKDFSPDRLEAAKKWPWNLFPAGNTTVWGWWFLPEKHLPSAL
jgi:hypothetical protein